MPGRAPKAQEDTPASLSEMVLWSEVFLLGIHLVGRFTKVKWNELPANEGLKESWINGAEFVIPAIEKTLFPLVSSRADCLTSTATFLLRLLRFNADIPPITDFVCRLLWKISFEEYNKTGKFSHVMSSSCRVIDEMCPKKIISFDVMQDFFDVRIRKLAKESCTDATLVANAEKLFIDEALKLLALEMELVDTPSTPEYEEERAAATTSIMNYFSSFELNRYFRYVHILYHEHLREESLSYPEAGYTLLLHANRLPWTDDKLEPFYSEDGSESLPAQPSWARRERLYLMAVDCFNKAELYEKSIELLQELERLHLMRKNFNQLASILDAEANAFEKAMEKRNFAPFFAIDYLGQGFSRTYQNKSSIYRGSMQDNVDKVIEQLQVKFPDAQIRKTIAASEIGVLRESDKKTIIVTAVEPSSEAEAEGKPRVWPEKMRLAQREYHRHNETCVFVRKSEQNSSMREFLFTPEPLPGTRRRYDVTDRKELRVTPLLLITEDIEKTSSELQTLFADAFKSHWTSLQKTAGLDTSAGAGSIPNASGVVTTPDNVPGHAQIDNDHFTRDLERYSTVLCDQVGRLADILRKTGNNEPELKERALGRVKKVKFLLDEAKAHDGYFCPQSALDIHDITCDNVRGFNRVVESIPGLSFN